jgi:hypothetical protein
MGENLVQDVSYVSCDKNWTAQDKVHCFFFIWTLSEKLIGYFIGICTEKLRACWPRSLEPAVSFLHTVTWQLCDFQFDLLFPYLNKKAATTAKKNGITKMI